MLSTGRADLLPFPQFVPGQPGLFRAEMASQLNFPDNFFSALQIAKVSPVNFGQFQLQIEILRL